MQGTFIQAVTDPLRPSCHASTLVETADGGLVAAWYAGSREGANDVAILCASRRAGSSTWAQPRVAVAPSGCSLGNPVLFRRGERLGLLYVELLGDGWESAVIESVTSDDGGETWSEARSVPSEPGSMIRNKPLALDDGTLLLPAYDERDWSSFLLASTDAGVTWTRRGVMSGPGRIQPALARIVDEAGEGVVAFFRRGVQDRTKRVWRSVSRDAGWTWSEPERTELPNPNASLDVVGLGANRLVLVFNDDPSERRNLSLAFSEDGGRTWPRRRVIEAGGGELSYPAIIEDASRRVHVTYTWHREWIRHVTLEAGESP